MLKIISQRQSEFNERYQMLSKRMIEIRDIVHSMSLPRVPCHNDTTPTNFILSDGVMYIIDWEYSGNNYSIWDLVCLAMESHFSLEKIKQMLFMYYDCEDQKLLDLFCLLMPVYEYWVALWAGVQITNGNVVDGIEGLISLEKNRLEGCEQSLASTQFKSALASLQPSTTVSNSPLPNHSEKELFKLFGSNLSAVATHSTPQPSVASAQVQTFGNF